MPDVSSQHSERDARVLTIQLYAYKDVQMSCSCKMSCYWFGKLSYKIFQVETFLQLLLVRLKSSLSIFWTQRLLLSLSDFQILTSTKITWKNFLVSSWVEKAVKIANSSWKNIKIKFTLLKKVSEVLHYTNIFLCACSVCSHFEFELKK